MEIEGGEIERASSTGDGRKCNEPQGGDPARLVSVKADSSDSFKSESLACRIPGLLLRVGIPAGELRLTNFLPKRASGDRRRDE